MYGRQARLPVEFNSRPAEDEEDPLQENKELDLETHISRMIEIRKKALQNIEAAQERQKKYYDTKHCKDKAQYKVGSLVLLFNSKKHSKKGLKLEPNWTGPYVIQ